MYTLVFFNLSMGCNQENIRQRPAALHLQVPSPSRGSWVNICKIHIYIYHIVCRLCIYVNYIYMYNLIYMYIYNGLCKSRLIFPSCCLLLWALYLGNDLPTWGIRSYIELATVAVPSRPICFLAWCARPSTDIKQRFFSLFQLCHYVSKILGSVLSIFVQIC